MQSVCTVQALLIMKIVITMPVYFPLSNPRFCFHNHPDLLRVFNMTQYSFVYSITFFFAFISFFFLDYVINIKQIENIEVWPELYKHTAITGDRFKLCVNQNR